MYPGITDTERGFDMGFLVEFIMMLNAGARSSGSDGDGWVINDGVWDDDEVWDDDSVWSDEEPLI